MKHFNGIETFIPNGKMLGPITQFLFNQNVGLNLAPLRLGTNFQIKFNFLMSFPGILASHSHSQKLGRQFSFPFPSPKFGNGLSYSRSCSQNPKSHSSGWSPLTQDILKRNVAILCSLFGVVATPHNSDWMSSFRLSENFRIFRICLDFFNESEFLCKIFLDVSAIFSFFSQWFFYLLVKLFGFLGDFFGFNPLIHDHLWL